MPRTWRDTSTLCSGMVRGLWEARVRLVFQFQLHALFLVNIVNAQIAVKKACNRPRWIRSLQRKGSDAPVIIALHQYVVSKRIATRWRTTKYTPFAFNCFWRLFAETLLRCLVATTVTTHALKSILTTTCSFRAWFVRIMASLTQLYACSVLFEFLLCNDVRQEFISLCAYVCVQISPVRSSPAVEWILDEWTNERTLLALLA